MMDAMQLHTQAGCSPYPLSLHGELSVGPFDLTTTSRTEDQYRGEEATGTLGGEDQQNIKTLTSTNKRSPSLNVDDRGTGRQAIDEL